MRPISPTSAAAYDEQKIYRHIQACQYEFECKYFTFVDDKIYKNEMDYASQGKKSTSEHILKEFYEILKGLKESKYHGDRLSGKLLKEFVEKMEKKWLF
jgi:hypothetical protein